MPSSAPTTTKESDKPKYNEESGMMVAHTPEQSAYDLPESSKPTTPSTPSSQPHKSGPGRSSRPVRRTGVQQVRLEAVEDPLGPLGNNAPASQADSPPAPPQKEQVLTYNQKQPITQSQSGPIGRNMLDPDDEDDGKLQSSGPRIPPPVQPSPGAPIRRDTQPSVSVEQAAKPTFDITVGDPHKVGDLTSSHIVYLVKTKVGHECTESRYKC